MRARYIEVDLLIGADFDLRKLVRSFGDAAYALSCGHRQIGPLLEVVIELNEPHMSLNKTLRRFCEVIESLPKNGRALWDKASKRVLDVGFESGDSGRAMHVVVQPKLLTRIAALGATLAVTIYVVPPPFNPASSPRAGRALSRNPRGSA